MEFVQTVRDVLISLYLLAGIVLTLALLIFAYGLYRAMRALLGAVTRAAENVG